MYKKDIKLMAFVASAIFWGSGALANDVYIEQAGGGSTFNITQTGGSGNRVGTSGTPSTFSGNTQAIDIIQQGGSNNTADLTVDGGSTTIDYTATGNTNSLLVEIDGGTGNTFTITKAGDSNRVTVCGANDVGSAANNAVACSSGVTVNDTVNTIAITGDSNSVNLALASPDATNTINIGQTTASDGNVVNITQTGVGLKTNTLTIDGDTNTVNVTQSGLATQVNTISIASSSNSVTLNQSGGTAQQTHNVNLTIGNGNSNTVSIIQTLP